MGFFPPFYFWQNRQEKSLWPYSRKKKNSFLDYKKKSKKKKKRKIGLIPHGLVHGFGPQVGFVPRFHFWQNRQEKSLWRYFRKKKGLTRLQKQGVKKNRKIGLFKKGFVNGFGQKMGFFPPFYFWQTRQEKRLWRYSKIKIRFSRL